MLSRSYLLLAVIYLITGCGSTKDNSIMKIDFSKAISENFDLQGHRGCRGLMPENTIPAMEEAVGMFVTTLEMDVVISKDGKVVLSHEPFFNHEISLQPNGKEIPATEERNFNMYTLNYAEIAKYDVGSKPHPRFPSQQKMKVAKPLLTDVFSAVQTKMMTMRRPPVRYNIETKTMPETDGKFHPEPAVFVDKLMKVIQDAGMEDFVTIQSFDFRTLQYLNKKYPKVKTAMLIEAVDKRSLRKQLDDLGFTPTIYSPEQSIVNPVLIRSCHEKGIQVIPWTVNEVADMKKLKAMGVDGLISDYPDRYTKL